MGKHVLTSRDVALGHLF